MAGIELPKDAEGREIPLDVDALYDKNGERVEVFRWNYVRGRKNNWTFNLLFEYPDVPHYPQDYHLAPPDSWEKLEDDLSRTAGASDAMCAYFGDDNRDCVACRLNKDSFKGIPYCNMHLAFTDILNRIRRLRGED